MLHENSTRPPNWIGEVYKEWEIYGYQEVSVYNSNGESVGVQSPAVARRGLY
jgi:hypothetical protein